MATFKLTDSFAFSTDIEAGPGALSRYFQSLPDWAALAINLKMFTDTTWDDPEVVSTHNLLSFTTPTKIGGQNATLTLSAGLNGTLSIFVPSTDNDPLFNPDLFGDNIPVRLDERYVSASLQASFEAGVGVPVDNLSFGFDGKSAVNLTYCQPFRLNPTTPKVLDSIKQTLADFAIPADIHDVAAMQEGSVAMVDSSGALQFSSTVNLLTFVNPLASVNVPVAGDLKVTAGGSITVGAGFEYSGDYQIRVRRLANSMFHLGFYRKRQTDFSLTANANAGIGGPLDSGMFQSLMGVISSAPQDDQNELAAAGLPPATINAIQCALKSALDRTLSLGVSMELHDISDTEAMFLYEVDLAALATDANSTALIANALHGDLSGLVAGEHNPGTGIRVLKTLVESGKTLKHAFKVNLLGIYNALSISTLCRTGAVAWDATTGEYVMTDSVNASSLGIDAVNFGANSDKLRHVLAENLLFTAAYRAGACVSGPPSLQARHTYFALSVSTSQDLMLHHLMIGAGLGFQEAETAEQALPHLQNLGRTTVLAEASYDDGAFSALFFNGDQLRDESYYDRAGRNALQYLTRPGNQDGYRLRAAQDDALWAQMREIGNVGSAEFRELFPDLPVESVQTIGVDYLNIVWWTQAMLDTGAKLLAIRQYLSRPGTGRSDPEFLKRKQNLADKLSTLAVRTHQDFGGPWGFLAMRLAAPRAGIKFIMFNPNVPLMCEAPLPIAVPV